MKFLPLLALAFQACSARSVLPAKPEPPAKWPIALIGKYSAAHACPVDGRIVTASHVAYVERIEGGRMVATPLNYLYTAGDGEFGVAVPGPVNQVVDLALLTLDPPYAGEYHKRGQTPQIGDEVNWVEFDFRTARQAYMPRQRTARVVNARIGHIMIEPSPVPGASGSCLFNTAGEVVGIISGGINTANGQEVGLAVGLDLLP